jgi:hypothetical protein
MARQRLNRPISARPAIWGLVLIASYFGMWIVIFLVSMGVAASEG